jgi:YD repeat-containing protein
LAAFLGDHRGLEILTLPSREVLATLPDRTVAGAAFTPDRTHVATVESDDALHVRQLPDGVEVARMDHTRRAFGPHADPTGRLFATTSEDGWAWVWTWWAEDLIGEARRRGGRDLTTEERALYLPDGPEPGNG